MRARRALSIPHLLGLLLTCSIGCGGPDAASVTRPSLAVVTIVRLMRS